MWTMNNLIIYQTPSWLTAFTTGRDSGVEALGLRLEDLALPRPEVIFISRSVFQAPQEEHFPAQFEVSAPHSEQI